MHLVKFIYTKTKIDLEIIDDGIGFNEETAQRAKLNHHLGLRSMQKRIELLQDEFEIISIRGLGYKGVKHV